ncbi:MAG: hypothetical protein PHG85_00370 [Candidatus Altiarchaeota archaeon]|nr:hypothetical protein [Candidatus Altiarchaeota archaeon]
MTIAQKPQQPEQTILGDVNTLIGRVRVNLNYGDKPDILPYPETKNLDGSVRVSVTASQNPQSYSRSIGVGVIGKDGQPIKMPDHLLALIDMRTGKDEAIQSLENGRASYTGVKSDRYRLEIRPKEGRKPPGPMLDVGLK